MNRTLLGIGAVVLVLLLVVWYFTNIFVYLAISVVLATLLRPVASRINRLQLFGGRLPRTVSVLTSFGMVVAVISLFVLLFVPLISEQIEILSHADFDAVMGSFLQPIQIIEGFLINKNLTSEPPGFLVSGFQNSFTHLLDRVQLADIINQLISFTSTFFIGTIAVVFITFFLLYEKGILRRQLIAIVPNRYFEVFIAGLFKIEKLFSNYLLGLLFQMFAMFGLSCAGMFVLGVPYAATIGVFAALSNLVPYLGPLLGAGFGLVVTVSTTPGFELDNDGVFYLMEILIVFAVIQAIDNLILQPLIFSKSVKAHPLEIFVVIFVAATLAGIPGMIVAIPVYTVIRVSSSEIYAGFNQYRVFKTKS